MKQMFWMILAGLVIMACSVNGAETNTNTPTDTDLDRGTLEFRANGEDFVRQGFVSKDGWQIAFDHLYVTLSEVEAYQSDPPYDASTGEAIAGEAIALVGPYTLDLAAGDENAEPLVIGSVDDVATGHYNALGWKMVPATEGDAAGYTLRMEGTATKADQSIAFTLNIEDAYSYTCGEYIGDERKGFLSAASTTEVEATFHFDHIFGDGDVEMEDSLNVGALGFDPLAAVAEGELLEADLAILAEKLSPTNMATLRDTLATLGHVGEGHCYEATGGFTGHTSE